MNTVATIDFLPNPYHIAKKIKCTEKKYNGYPHLIQALLSEVPELRQCRDEDVIHYHDFVRQILTILKNKNVYSSYQ